MRETRMFSAMLRALRAIVPLRLTSMCMLVVPSLCSAAIDWEGSWDVRVKGQRLSVENFTSRMPPIATAHELARLGTTYERIIIADGRILLSGLVSGAHWLAEIQWHPDGAQGYVSALYFDHGSAGARHSVFNQGPGLSALRVFEFDASTAVGFMAVVPEPSRKRMPGSKTGHANGMPGIMPSDGSRGVSTVTKAAPALIVSDAHPGMAVAVSMRER